MIWSRRPVMSGVLCMCIALSCTLGAKRPNNRQRYEHDVCNDKGWTCQRLTNCPAAIRAIQENERPDTCGFDGVESIVCCPGDTNSVIGAKITQTRSSKKCKEYSDTLCRSNKRIRKRSMRHLIFGGEHTRPKEFPHMAVIGYGADPANIQWQCGGSLISERYVLSAAHCTYPSNLTGTAKFVRIGDLNTASDTPDARPQLFNIIERINHPQYRPPELYNDIALYKLDRVVTFDEYAKPVCLHESFSLPEGTGVATGWGRLEFAGPLSKKLMKANLTYVGADECRRLIGASAGLPRGIDSKSMVCAGEKDGSRDTCQGDSGGPLALQRHLQSTCLAMQVGITSFGRPCGTVNSPGVYTRVANYIPWIESIVWTGDD